MFLQELNGHENIIRLLNIIKAENNKDIYLVFDFMETDLHAVIRAKILQCNNSKLLIYDLLFNSNPLIIHYLPSFKISKVPPHWWPDPQRSQAFKRAS